MDHHDEPFDVRHTRVNSELLGVRRLCLSSGATPAHCLRARAKLFPLRLLELLPVSRRRRRKLVGGQSDSWTRCRIYCTGSQIEPSFHPWTFPPLLVSQQCLHHIQLPFSDRPSFDFSWLTSGSSALLVPPNVWKLSRDDVVPILVEDLLLSASGASISTRSHPTTARCSTHTDSAPNRSAPSTNLAVPSCRASSTCCRPTTSRSGKLIPQPDCPGYFEKFIKL